MINQLGSTQLKIVRGLPPRDALEDELVAMDIEVFGFDTNLVDSGEFACITVCMMGNPDVVYFIRDWRQVPELLRRMDKGVWVFHNATYDLRRLKMICEVDDHLILDTQIFERDLFGGYYDKFGLDALARRWLGVRLRKDIRDKFRTATDFTPEMEEYAARDAWATLRVAIRQLEYVTENDINPVWYWEIDAPCIWAVLDFLPVKLDVDLWMMLRDESSKRGRDLEKKLGLNVYSHPQVREFVGKLVGRELDKAGASILKGVAEDLRHRGREEDAELVEEILEARKWRKQASSYGANWIEKYVRKGGLIIPDWIVTGAETGRTACRKPSLQNVPVRRDIRYRRAFISQYPNGVILVSDVAQQELRINAYLSKDPLLLEAFRSGEDVHEWTAKEQGTDRDTAKTLNYGMSYGMSPYGLAARLQISNEEAKKRLDDYFKKFRGVHAYIKRMRQRAKRDGYVTTTTGRPIWLNPYNYKWRNNAVNGPIQGSGGDHMKLACVKIREYCKSEGLLFPVTMMIHDEIVADIGEPALVPQYEEITRAAWVDAGERIIPGIPIEVDVHTGRTWAAKKEDE